MGHEKDSLLGKDTRYDHPYDPGLLFPLDRATNRSKLALGADLPFIGEDVWTAFELSWLTPQGKPVVAIAEFRLPHDSPCMIESKSLKLYLNSLNHHPFVDQNAVQATLEQDLSAAAQAPVAVRLLPATATSLPLFEWQDEAICIDDEEAESYVYSPDASLLALRADSTVSDEILYSDLLRSNCPVTGQPDWATLIIRYTGPTICRRSLLRYVVSFRQCQDFHEHCVERIFGDLMAQCQPDSLQVYARYTRRGGLDINPYRATPNASPVAPAGRTVRQ